MEIEPVGIVIHLKIESQPVRYLPALSIEPNYQNKCVLNILVSLFYSVIIISCKCYYY